MGAVHPIQAGSITLRADGILHTVFDFEEGDPKAAAEEYIALREELIDSDPGPVLLELIRIPYVDRATRKFLMDGLTPPSCRAVVASDAGLLTLFRSFELVESTEVPTRLFSTVAAAVDWIHSQAAEE